MAVKTSAELKTQIDTIIKVNGNREITPPKHNSILTNVIDSYLNKSDGGVLSAMLEYSYNPSFTTDYQIIHKKYVDDAISGITTGLTYQGTWDANTNTPTIASGIGTNGYYYIVNVAGTTNIDGVNDWEVGDWILFNGTTWQKIDQSTKWSDGFPTYDLRYQGLAANLTSLSGLTYASTSFVKMTAAGTFALDTNTYASASDLTSYAKLDGSNQPFTGNVTIQKATPILRVKRTTGSANLYIDADNAGTSDLSFSGLNNWVRFWNGGIGSSQSFGIVNNNSLTTFFSVGTRSVEIGGNQLGGTYGNKTSYQVSGTYYLSNLHDFRDQNFIQYAVINPAANVNNLVLSHSIKVGNTTQTAAVAGAGSIRYNSGLEVSDASNWEKAVVSPTANVKVTAAAPYTNDGYIEVRINGTLIKLMTTA